MKNKNEKVHALVNAGPYPGMSEAFDAHIGAPSWTDPAYSSDASLWAAAWKAATTAERDRCAKLCEDWASVRTPEHGGLALLNIAERIRRA